MKTDRSILVFATQHMPTGGIESHLMEFCLQMSRVGVAIDLVITNSAMRPDTEELYKKLCREVYLGKSENTLARLIWLVSTGLAVSTSRYNALYTNGQGESILLFEKFVRHGGHWVHHHHTAGDKSDQATWGPRYFEVMKKADSIIACSGTNARSLQETVSRSVSAIPCFSRDLGSVIKTASNIVRLGYYGRLIPEKGIEILCRLSEEPELADVEMHIWGEGEAFPESYFLQYPKVIFHGPFFGKAELIAIVSQLDAYLLISSHPEGLPIALLEVMSAGMPWLATNKGGVKDIACDSLSTRVIPANPGYLEIKKAVLLLIADIKNGKLDGASQKELYARNFSPERLVNRWSEVLDCS